MPNLQPNITKLATGDNIYALVGTGGGQVNGIGAGTGISVNSSNPAIPIVSATGLAGAVGGTAISVVTSSPGNIATITNDGVTQVVQGSGIGVSSGTGSVTITNNGVVAVAAGSGLSTTGNVGSITLTNTGVRTLTAGANISLSGTPNDITIAASGAANPPFLSSITLGACAITAGAPGTGVMPVVLGTKMLADFTGGTLPSTYTYVVDLANVNLRGVGNTGLSDLINIFASDGTSSALVKSIVVAAGLTDPVLEMGQVFLNVNDIRNALGAGVFDRFTFANGSAVAYASVSVPTSPVPAMCFPAGIQ